MNTYWAVERDSQRFVDNLEEILERSARYLEGSRWYERVQRNYFYYNGEYFDRSQGGYGMELTKTGDDDEFTLLAANHVRNFGKHLISQATNAPPALAVKATNTDNESQNQAKIASGIIDYYKTEKQLVEKWIEMAETCFVFTTSFILTTWNPWAGRKNEYGVPDGDVETFVLSPLDVCYDLRCRRHEQSPWKIATVYVNRWDLASRFPAFEREIIDYAPTSEEKGTMFEESEAWSDDVDLIPLRHFFHERTDAVPEGRYCQFIPGTYLLDLPITYAEIPIRRMAAGEMLLSSLGYSMGFDIQGLNEMYNGCMSAIASAIERLGLQDIWVPGTSGDVKARVSKAGFRVLSGAGKPEALDYMRIPPDIFKFLDILNGVMQVMAGIPGLVRGEPQPADRSGEAMKVIEAQSLVFNSAFQGSWHRMIEQSSMDLIRVLRDFGGESERIITIMGKHNQMEQRSFFAKDLQKIDRVTVELTNPMSRTISGRWAIARDAVAMGQQISLEKYNEILQTGTVEEIYEMGNAQMSIIRQENDLLQSGGIPPPPDPTDNQLLHVREHAVLLSNMENRMNPAFRSNVQAHLMQHIEISVDPMNRALQQALGYPILPPEAVMGIIQSMMGPAGPAGGNGNGAGPRAPAGGQAEGVPPERRMPPAEPREMAAQPEPMEPVGMRE